MKASAMKRTGTRAASQPVKRAAPKASKRTASKPADAAHALEERFAGGEALLAREAEVLAKLEASLTDWWAWAQRRAEALAGDAGALLRQRMADVLIEQLVATAVLTEARDPRQAAGVAGEARAARAATAAARDEGEGEARAQSGLREAAALLRQRVRRCLQLAIEALAESRGEDEAAGELAWMRRELTARRPQLAPRGEGGPS